MKNGFPCVFLKKHGKTTGDNLYAIFWMQFSKLILSLFVKKATRKIKILKTKYENKQKKSCMKDGYVLFYTYQVQSMAKKRIENNELVCTFYYTLYAIAAAKQTDAAACMPFWKERHR